MPVQDQPNDMGHIDAANLHKRRQAGEEMWILDVREPWEHAQGVIEGAILMPMDQVQRRWGELEAGGPINVICHVGGRSARVAAFLVRQGLQAVNVDDGMDGWERQGFPTVR